MEILSHEITSCAPVVLFVYDRPEHARKTIDALRQNILADCSDLIIYADGPKKDAGIQTLQRVEETRKFMQQVTGFHSVRLYLSEYNKGLAASVIEGVSKTVSEYGKVIVLEDDIVTGRYFLEYMNFALEAYKDQKKVWHITGWHEPDEQGDRKNSFFYPLMDCWSWGTWEDRWKYFKKNPKELVNSYTPSDIYKFNVEGLVLDKWNQVIGNNIGRNNTWAVFWYAVIMEHDGLCLAPCVSLVNNIGFDNTGVHSKKKAAVGMTADIGHRVEYFPDKICEDASEYERVKKAYKSRYRSERIRQAVKKLIPKRLLEWRLLRLREKGR